jgi:hypothetical protein
MLATATTAPASSATSASPMLLAATAPTALAVRSCASARTNTPSARWYQAAAGAGNACRLKTECTDSPKRRQVTRSFAEAYLERVRGDHATKEFEGHAQTHSPPVRRSQGLAWAAPLPPAGAGEHQQRGAADRGRAEPEARAESPGVRTAPVPERRGRRHPAGAPIPASPGSVTTLDRPDQRSLPHGTAPDPPPFSTVADGPSDHDRGMKDDVGAGRLDAVLFAGSHRV